MAYFMFLSILPLFKWVLSVQNLCHVKLIVALFWENIHSIIGRIFLSFKCACPLWNWLSMLFLSDSRGQFLQTMTVYKRLKACEQKKLGFMMKACKGLENFLATANFQIIAFIMKLLFTVNGHYSHETNVYLYVMWQPLRKLWSMCALYNQIVVSLKRLIT